MRDYQQLSQLHRIIETEIRVRHIATFDLFSAGPEDDATGTRAEMERLRIDVAPLREDDESSRYVQYVHVDNLKSGRCRERARPISLKDIAEAELPLTQILNVLVKQRFLFVLADRRVNGIVTRSDLQRVPVRMLLFGLITLLEMNMRAAIKYQYGETMPDDVLNAVGPKRLEDAKDLLRKKRRNNEDVGLRECLQLCDLRDIFVKVKRHEANLMSKALPTATKTPFVKRLREFEDYRNNIAHAMQLTVHELGTLFADLRDMIERMEAWVKQKGDETDEEANDTEHVYPTAVENGSADRV